MKIITLINNKGGVAKTTTTHNLGCALAKLGKKVALMDLGPQANLTARFNDDIIKPSKDFLSIIRLNRPLVFDDFTKSNIENVWLIPNLKNFNDEVFNYEIGLDQFFVLSNLFSNLKDEFDFILIDTPPLIGKISQNALIASDYLILPIKFDLDSIEGAEVTLAYLESWKKRQDIKAEVLGMVATHVRGVQMNNFIINEVKKRDINCRVFKNSIPIYVGYDEARVAKQPVFEYKKDKTHYIELAKEVLNYV